MNKIIIAAAVLAASASLASAQPMRPMEPATPDFQFTTVKANPITSVKNQSNSGTCWCFSSISFIESEIMKNKGIAPEDLDLSEMWVVGHSYYDRGIKYVRLDGKLGFSAGSDFGDVFTTIKEYGIVPQDAYAGTKNYGEELPKQGELDAVLAGYIEAVAKVPNRQLTTAWKNGYKGIIEAYLGEAPESFTWKGATYTPESFRDYLGINADDYVSLTSYTHHPFYEPFVIEVCDNWRWDPSYNLPIDELMEVMYNAIDKGYTIAWGSDVSESGFTRNGLAIMPEKEAKAPAAPGSDQQRWTGDQPQAGPQPQANGPKPEAEPYKDMVITQEMRQEAYDRKTTTDDHGMHIYGVAKDQNGNKFFMVKNSWGETGKYKGTWYASESFVKYKTMNIVVNKNAIPKDIQKKLGLK